VLESKHRRGPFDVRYPARAVAPAPLWELPTAPDAAPRLTWAAFALRFHPGRRRHDFDALASYAAYGRVFEVARQRRASCWPALGEREPDEGSPSRQEPGRFGTRRSAAPA
jgi:hypothetical protein